MESRIPAQITFVLMVALSIGTATVAFAAVELGGPITATEQYGLSFETAGLTNPSYRFDTSHGEMEVSFGTHFLGQTFGHSHNSLLDTTPISPLQLGGTSMTMFDVGNPNGIVLGGTDGAGWMTTPLAILFDQSVNFISFDLGHLDENTDTTIEAFDTTGASLGVFSGLPSGYNNFALNETTGANTIAGISIYVPDMGMDWEGFGLDNVSFGFDENGPNPQVPEPATIVVWTLLGSIVGGCTWMKRRRKA